MAMSWLKRARGGRVWPAARDERRRWRRRHACVVAAVEPLDRRVMLTVTASFGAGEVRVTGDDADNVIVVSRTVAGAILVNGGAVPIVGGAATVANTFHFHIVGGAGDDRISLDETNGALPGAALFGGAGNDVLVGGSSDDFAEGEGGNDTVSLGAGEDTFGWNPGDGSDVVDGQGGIDNLVFNGSELGEKFGISDVGTGTPFHRVRLTRDVGNVALDLGGFESINLNPLAGADTVTIDDQTATDLSSINIDLEAPGSGSGDGLVDSIVINGTNGDDVGQVQSFPNHIAATMGLFPLVNLLGADAGVDRLTLNALGGDDTVDASDLASNTIVLTIDGGAGSDQIFGSAGSDMLIGGPGRDKVFMGDGDDTFAWSAGDGSDVVEGEGGTDSLVFNGSAADEAIGVAANGARVRVTDDVGDVSLDVDGVEQAGVAPLTGADDVVVGDLTGTALRLVRVKLLTDAGADNVTVNGTNGADAIDVTGDLANGVAVAGLFARVEVVGGFGTTDGLAVHSMGGADGVDASGLAAGLVNLSIDGGAGDDLLTGSGGNDQVVGGAGNDVAHLGAGDDTFTWNPGDGSDTVEGQTGHDALVFNGAATSETIALSANGGRLRLTRDAGGVIMDVDDVERVDVNTGHASDSLTVNDLSGTDVTDVRLNVDPDPGNVQGGAPSDRVVVSGTAGADHLQVTRTGGGYSVAGLTASIAVGGVEISDLLLVNGLGGDDVIDASALPANVIQLAIDAGEGNDTVRGSQGNDFVVGRGGSDMLFLGSGDDTFVWNAGDGSDLVEGQGGSDTLNFNGSDQNERFEFSASGARVRLTRDVGGVTMDLGGVERVNVGALGGADSVVVNDLTGTELAELDVDLAPTSGGGTGDGQVDSVVVNGSDRGELLPVSGAAGAILVNGSFQSVNGLPYFVLLKSVDPTDSLRINGNGGDDTVRVDLATAVNLSVDGGAGHDTIDARRTEGAGVVRVMPGAGDDEVDVDTDGAGAANVVFDATQRIGALSVGVGGTATVTAGGAKVLTVTSIDIEGAGRLDLADNALVVDYSSATSPIGNIRTLLEHGFSGGAWNGAGGIGTSRGNASAFGLGFGEASDVAAGGRFMGQGVDGSAVVVRFTTYGDANLDGAVDFSDLVRLAQHYNTTGGGWSQGNFNYDNAVDFGDLVRLAQHYNTAGGASVQAQFQALTSAEHSQPVSASVRPAVKPKPVAVVKRFSAVRIR